MNIQPELEENILGPYFHIMSARSNMIIINKLPEVLNYWLRIPEDKVNAIKDILCTVLASIILFDDIQDDSLYRRNLPAAHCVYGIPLTINASIHALLLGLDKCCKLGCSTVSDFVSQAVTLYNSNMLNYMRGQGADIYWRENDICPTEEEYKRTAICKAGAVLNMVNGLMQMMSSKKILLDDFIVTFSIYYTIRDDYCNIMKPEALEERSRTAEMQGVKATHFCEDITEGKISWPIIHALKSEEGATILGILKQRTRDIQTKKHCLSLMEKVGSLEYTRVTLRTLERELRDQVEQIGENAVFQNMLEDLQNWDDN